MSGEDVVNESGAYAGNVVGTDGCAHAAAAESDSAINCASGYGPSQRDHVIRIIVSGFGCTARSLRCWFEYDGCSRMLDLAHRLSHV